MGLRELCNRRKSSGNIDAVRKLLTVFMLFSLPAFGQSQSKVQGDFNHVGDTSRLEFKGLASWTYSIRRSDESGKSKIYIEIPTLKKESLDDIKNWKSPLIDRVEVSEEQGSAEKTILVVFLNRSDVQSFNYQVESPSQLIVDFFIQTTAVEVKSAEKIAKKLPPKNLPPKIVMEHTEPKPERKPASDTPPVLKASPNDEKESAIKGGVFDGSDPNFERFAIKNYEIKKEAIEASKKNIYLPWPMLQMPYEEIDDIVSAKPVYQIQIGVDEENEQARFLLHLFEKQRFAAFLKAYKVFKKKFPATKYNEILEYIYADIHMHDFKTSKSNKDFETAINTYTEMMVRYPNSPMFDRTAILVANAYLQEGELVRALRMFQKYLNDRKESTHRDVIQLAIAHAYAGLNQHDSATNTLIQVSKTAQNPKYAMEARFRLGDTAFIQRKFEQAVDMYAQTLKESPTAVSKYPNLYFNMGEALFWLGRHVESLESFRHHVRLFPSHPYSAYALTRLGELLDLMGASKVRAHAAMMESYFRFYPEPGAQVARLRLLTARLSEMKPKEYKSAYKEIIETGEKDVLPGMNEFVTLIFTDALNDRGEYQDALDRLIKYHQLHPTSLNLETFRVRIARILSEEIKSLIDKGDFIAGLDKYEKHSKLWLKGVNQRDLNFSLAKAFERAGVMGEAHARYQALFEEIEQDSVRPAKLGMFDTSPAADRVHLRLARVLFEQNQFAKSIEHLQKVTHEEALTEPERIERVELAASVFQKTGQSQQAVTMLTRLIDSWKGHPELVSTPLMQKANVYAGMENYPEAIAALEQVIKVNEKTQKVDPKVMAQAFTQLGDWNIKAKNTDKGIENYQQALSNYEAAIPMPDVRYRLGQAYFEKGSLKEAEQTWEKLDPKNSRFWYQMAQEQMKQDKFSAGYKKYIDRIPAMVNLPKGEKTGDKL